MSGTQETTPHMRRSISMPVKPQYLEPKKLKRSAEKETVFATTDEELSSDGEDNSYPLNCRKQQHADNTQTDNDEESTSAILKSSKTSQHSPGASAKPFRSVRDFFSPILTIFRKATTWSGTPTTTTAISFGTHCEGNSKSINRQNQSSTGCMERHTSELSSADEEHHKNGHPSTFTSNDDLMSSATVNRQKTHEKVTFTLT